MIEGKVDALRQARVQLEMRGADGRFQSIEAVVDTGFDGHLTLPPEVIAGLDVEPDMPADVDLAAGLRETVNTWRGYVLWHDRLRPILILESAGIPLLGMELLEGSQLTIQARINGNVLIERLDDTNP